MKQREGDQPLPTITEGVLDIQSRVIQDIISETYIAHDRSASKLITDITERREVGITRYGTALQPNNGRDALRDAYEEAIDLCMYLKQMIVERQMARGVAGTLEIAYQQALLLAVYLKGLERET